MMARRFAGTLATLVVGIAIGTAANRHDRRAAAGAAARSRRRRAGQPSARRRDRAVRRASSRPNSRRTSIRRRAASRCGCTPWTRREWAPARSTAASTSCISASASRKWRSSRSTAPQIVGVWQHLGNPDTLVWMLAYRDRAHREDVWAKFAADPDWKALSSKYSVPISANVFMMSATDYSPLK